MRRTYYFARASAYSGALQLLALYWSGRTERESELFYLTPYLALASVA